MKNNGQNHTISHNLITARQENEIQFNKINLNPTTMHHPNKDKRKSNKQSDSPTLGFLIYEEEEIQESLEPSISSIGKIVTENPIHKRSL